MGAVASIGGQLPCVEVIGNNAFRHASELSEPAHAHLAGTVLWRTICRWPASSAAVLNISCNQETEAPTTLLEVLPKLMGVRFDRHCYPFGTKRAPGTGQCKVNRVLARASRRAVT